MDWSLSYFDGFDLLPDLSVENASPTAEQISVSYHRVRVIGADTTRNVGHYALRAEAAHAFTQNSSGRDPFLKEPYFFCVLGGDRTYGGELNVNLQYIFRIVVNYHPGPARSNEFTNVVATEEAIIGNQAARVQHGASTRIGDKWLHETLEENLVLSGTSTRTVS